MSNFAVTIEEIKEIKPHPNADKLELVLVKGWQCVVRKGLYKEKDMVVYIPVDSILPIELSDRLGVTSYLTKQRVRTVKLRGEYSQGLLFSTTSIIRLSPMFLHTDVTKKLGITKYEQPIPIEMSGIQRKHEPKFVKYIDIENIKNFPDIFEEGEKVHVSEKIHGTNIRIANIDGEIHVGSHNVDLVESETNLYWRVTKEFRLHKILPDGYQLFGEVYGKGVQGLHYGTSRPHVRFFDLMIKGVYTTYAVLDAFCEENNLDTVPFLGLLKWDRDILKLGEGNSFIAKHVKEGIVIKPLKERTHPSIGRVIFKHINEKYLLKDYGDLH